MASRATATAWAAMIVLGIAGLSACGGRHESAHGWAAPSELVWLKRFGGWSHSFERANVRFDAATRAVYRSAGTEGMPALKRAAARLGACGHSLDAAVPTPPSDRLNGVLATARRACARFAEAAQAIRTSRQAVVYGVVSNTVTATLRRARLGLQQARQAGLVGMTGARVDVRLGRLAGTIAKRPVRVRCWPASSWTHLSAELAALEGKRPLAGTEGVTPVGGGHIDVRGDICHRLDRLAARPRAAAARSFATANALRVLVHESEHARGYANEAETECVALQRVAQAARLFGVSSPDARRLALLMWSAYPLEAPGYHTAKCHNGGPYDLRPRDAHWP